MKKWNAKFIENAVKVAMNSTWDEIHFENGNYHYQITFETEITSDYKLRVDHNNGIIWAIHKDEIKTGVINYFKIGMLKNGIAYKL